MRTRLAFIDETTLKTNMAKTTGWAPCGARLVDHAPFGHWQTQTFIAALRHDRLDAPWVIGGTINQEFFDLYVETQLAPTLHKGDVVILDNLATHRSPKAAEILKDIGAWFVFRGKPSTGRLSDPSNSCRLAPPISARSKWHSPRSKPRSERWPPEPMTNSGKLSETSATSSMMKNATTSLRQPDMKPIERNGL